MPRISRGIALLCDQVWMAGAPIAARPSCRIASSFLSETCLLAFHGPKVARLSRAITPNDCSWREVSYKWHIMSDDRSRSEGLWEGQVT
jgi:hypothetical protein